MFFLCMEHLLIILHNLLKALQTCEDMSLALNWEKHHFMLQKGVVLGTFFLIKVLRL